MEIKEKPKDLLDELEDLEEQLRKVTHETPGNLDVRVGEYLRDSVETEDKPKSQ